MEAPEELPELLPEEELPEEELPEEEFPEEELPEEELPEEELPDEEPEEPLPLFPELPEELFLLSDFSEELLLLFLLLEGLTGAFPLPSLISISAPAAFAISRALRAAVSLVYSPFSTFWTTSGYPAKSSSWMYLLINAQEIVIVE